MHVHADHRRESYVDGMGQVKETGGIDGPETDVDEISPLHSLIAIYEMTYCSREVICGPDPRSPGSQAGSHRSDGPLEIIRIFHKKSH